LPVDGLVQIAVM
jgi:5-methylcytosine-specific restriction protein A